MVLSFFAVPGSISISADACPPRGKGMSDLKALSHFMRWIERSEHQLGTASSNSPDYH